MQFVYMVRSNRPLYLGVGAGNMPTVRHDEGPWGMNLEMPDVVVTAESNGAAASVGHRMSMVLVELEDGEING